VKIQTTRAHFLFLLFNPMKNHKSNLMPFPRLL
jgi:hypothetical protein